MTRIRTSAPVDPTDRFTQQIQALREQVAELQRAAGVERAGIGGAWGRVAAQSVPNSTLTTVVWDTENLDAAGLASVPFSTLAIPAGASSWWDISASCAGVGGPGGTLRINAGGVPHDFPASQFSGRASGAVAGVPLAAAASVSVQVFQNSGAASNVTGTLYIRRLGL